MHFLSTVGNNKIDDRFSSMLKNTSSLSVLILRFNRFYGNIECPGTNLTWPNLQIIDIAVNSFTGYPDPRCISGRTSLDWQLIFTGLGFVFGLGLAITPLPFCKIYEDQLDRLRRLHFARSTRSITLPPVTPGQRRRPRSNNNR